MSSGPYFNGMCLEELAAMYPYRVPAVLLDGEGGISLISPLAASELGSVCISQESYGEGPVTLIDYAGSGCVRYMHIGHFALTDIFDVYIDDEESPSVQFSADVLGGMNRVSGATFSTPLVTITGSDPLIVLRLPIPFSTHIKIVGNASGSGENWSEVWFDQTQTNLRLKSGYLPFGSLMSQDVGPQALLNLSAGASGWILWHGMAMDGGDAGITYLENSFCVYLDGTVPGSPGSCTAQIQSTGGEDWFGFADYFSSETQQSVFSFCSATNGSETATAAVDLFALCGGIRYNNGVLFRWEEKINLTSITSSATYGSVVFYLEKTPPTPTAPVNSIIPSITGDAIVGDTLTCFPGLWSGYPAPSFAYQLQSSANGTSGWTNVGGATASTYELISGDEGLYMRWAVTATNGSGSATAYSMATVQVTATETLLTGLVAYYKLDEATGTETRADSSGNGYTLTPSVLIAAVTGIINNGATFTTQSLIAGSAFPSMTAFSMSEWINGSNGIFANIGVWDDGAGADNQWRVITINNLELNLGDGSTPITTACPNDGNWHHVVLTYDGATFTLYLDNVSLGTASYAQTFNSSLPLTIGVGFDGYPTLGTYTITGATDEVGVWSRKLSSTEVTALYNSGAGLAFADFGTTP